MKGLNYKDGTYETGRHKVSLLAKTFPALTLYRRVFGIVLRASARAKRRKYDDSGWCKSSLDTLRALESIGVKVAITGVQHFRDVPGPCVFVANHMSTLETFVLPIIIVPFKPATFVVKESLIDYPVFGHVMRSRDPITVGRANPRKDLQAVMEEGAKRLASGISIIIFPQTTRYLDFDPSTFNTIGIKLAKRAGVPVVPVALKTDAWGNGRFLKDFGRVDPSKRVYFAFGEPLTIKDRGAEQHREVVRFIGRKIKEWTR